MVVPLPEPGSQARLPFCLVKLNLLKFLKDICEWVRGGCCMAACWHLKQASVPSVPGVAGWLRTLRVTFEPVLVQPAPASLLGARSRTHCTKRRRLVN